MAGEQNQNQGNGAGLQSQGQSAGQNNMTQRQFQTQSQHVEDLQREAMKRDTETYEQYLVRMSQLGSTLGRSAGRQGGQ